MPQDGTEGESRAADELGAAFVEEILKCRPADRRPSGLSYSNFGIQSTLNQAMDSRFRGNDVISARHVTFALAVIPAKAGIHFGQRIPKLEVIIAELRAIPSMRNGSLSLRMDGTVRLRRAICDYDKSARAPAGAGTCLRIPTSGSFLARTTGRSGGRLRGFLRYDGAIASKSEQRGRCRRDETAPVPPADGLPVLHAPNRPKVAEQAAMHLFQLALRQPGARR